MQKCCTKPIYNALDVFRLFFAVCVVAIHTYALDGLPQTWSFWLTQGILRLATPFFFVTSGFLLGRKLYGQEKNKRGHELLDVLVRYSVRLLKPLLLVGGANAVLELFSQWLRDGRSLLYLTDHLVRHILFYPYGAMWFVQACIVGVWLLYPFLKIKKINVALLVGALLYAWALLCNNYYFLAQRLGLKETVDSYMEIFLSARNGVFVGFLFLALGIKTWKWYSAGGRIWSIVRRWRFIMLTSVCLLYALEIYLTQSCTFLDDRGLYLTHVLLVPLVLLCIADIKLSVSDAAAHWMRRASIWLYFSHRFIYEFGGLLCILKFGIEWRGLGAFATVLGVSAASCMMGVGKIICIPILTCAFLFLQFHDYRIWKFASYGTNTDSGQIICMGSYDIGEVTIETTGNGKMVVYGADGLSFYYTKLDASKKNFVLSAQVSVDSWTMTNGEDDGFGLMVSDSVGKDGDSADFWNNSYMAAVTKVEYKWNPETGKASNVGEPVIMRQGIAAREKIGSTEPHPESAQEAAHAQTVRTFTLEESQGKNGAGTYNIIGNCSPITAAGGEEHQPFGTVQGKELLTTMHLELCRDNTGYRIRYIEEDGTVHEKLFYDVDRENLAAIDPKNIYVGFFVARYARVTFQNMSLTVTDAQEEPAAEEPLPEVLEPDFQVTSSHTANAEEYELVFETNYKGTLSVKGEQGEPLVEGVFLKAGEKFSLPCLLQEGENRYEISFLPEKDGDGKVTLSDFSKAVFWHSVSYQKIGDEKDCIYTSPDIEKADDSGTGTKEDPVSLATAAMYAAPGQKILLAEGEYLLEEPLVIERGHDGTEEKPIYLMSDPANEARPVLDFQGKCKGITLSADYWLFDGFDCTGSAVNEYGIHLTGSHNRMENLEIYRNGNTGLHISSLSLWDDVDEWPSDNLILNCVSYGNCDDAYEDADGFACQFTAGSRNMFDGCTAHHNADDGWDFYAKVWLEPLGPVTLKNCTAYRNGYLEDGREAGNGNGFKLGGDDMSGGHILENCLSYENRNEGFTSNTCPDVTLINCTALDNGGCNIRLYTKNQANTAYVVQNTRSLRTDINIGKSDILEGRGTQVAADLYSEGNYYWDAKRKVSINSKGEQIKAELLPTLVEQ